MTIHMLAPLPEDDNDGARRPKQPAHRNARPNRGILVGGGRSGGRAPESDRSSVLIPAFVAGAGAGYLVWRVGASWMMGWM